MPYQINWLVENRVMLNRLSEKVTAEEIVQSSRQATPLIDTGLPPVYFIVDVSQMKEFPTKLADFRSVYQEPISENLGLVIFYGIHNRSLNFLATLVTQLVRIKFQVVNNQAEALALVEKTEGRKFTITNPSLLDPQ